MSKICKITGKKPMFGNRRSHAMNANKRKFFPNLHFHKFWNPYTKQFISLRISAKGIRNIDKLGFNNINKLTKTHKKK